MNRHATTVVIAGCGALAYTISKVELAIRGELGLPGFPAPVSGQLSNAGFGLVMVVLIAVLVRPPERRWLRRVLLAANWLGAAAITVMVVTFACRATGLVPALGEPAVGASTWLALAVGAAWAAAWCLASASIRRQLGA